MSVWCLSGVSIEKYDNKKKIIFNKNHLKNFIKFVKEGNNCIRNTETIFDVIVRALTGSNSLNNKKQYSVKNIPIVTQRHMTIWERIKMKYIHIYE